MLTVNADAHYFMKAHHKPKDEKLRPVLQGQMLELELRSRIVARSFRRAIAWSKKIGNGLY